MSSTRLDAGMDSELCVGKAPGSGYAVVISVRAKLMRLGKAFQRAIGRALGLDLDQPDDVMPTCFCHLPIRILISFLFFPPRQRSAASSIVLRQSSNIVHLLCKGEINPRPWVMIKIGNYTEHYMPLSSSHQTSHFKRTVPHSGVVPQYLT